VIDPGGTAPSAPDAEEVKRQGADKHKAPDQSRDFMMASGLRLRCCHAQSDERRFDLVIRGQEGAELIAIRALPRSLESMEVSQGRHERKPDDPFLRDGGGHASVAGKEPSHRDRASRRTRDTHRSAKLTIRFTIKRANVSPEPGCRLGHDPLEYSVQ
jgi:hypothetical protein